MTDRIRLWFFDGCRGKQVPIELPPNVKGRHVEAFYERCIILARPPRERDFTGEGKPFQNGTPPRVTRSGSKPYFALWRDFLISRGWAQWRNGCKRHGWQLTREGRRQIVRFYHHPDLWR